MLLSVENLKVSYDNIKALQGISFNIEEGEIVCIIGANGAGKSTTLRAISRLVPVRPGTRMTFMGKDLLRYEADKVVSELGISHVPEGRRLFGNLTVMENLALATFARKDPKGIAEDLERVFAIFPRLKEREGQKAGTMSGGEQQMLAVGRAFMSGRKIMLLDEPSMGLAPLLMKSVFDSLREINRREGTTILVVEQNARMALQFSRRGYVLENGRLVLEGKSDALLDDPQVKKAYLGG
jgi:branched-chain amino acid transport system ATP-binding protein